MRRKLNALTGLAWALLLLAGGGAIAQAQEQKPFAVVAPQELAISFDTSGSPQEKTVILRNDTDGPVTVSFCLVLAAEGGCTASAAGISVSATDTVAIPAHSVQAVNLQFAIATDAKPQKGHLVVRAQEPAGLVGVLPVAFARATPAPSVWGNLPGVAAENPVRWFLRNLTPLEVLQLAAVLALLILAVVLWRLGREYAKFWEQIRCLKMSGIEWKPSESWASTLVLGLGVLTGLGDLLPTTATRLTPDASSAYSVLFAALLLLAAFAYSAFTQTSEGEESQAPLLVFLVASFIATLALLGQLGVQVILVEELRGKAGLPDFFLDFCQVFLWVVILLALWYVPRKLLEQIRQQQIVQQIKLCQMVPGERAALQAFSQTRASFGADFEWAIDRVGLAHSDARVRQIGRRLQERLQKKVAKFEKVCEETDQTAAYQPIVDAWQAQADGIPGEIDKLLAQQLHGSYAAVEDKLAEVEEAMTEQKPPEAKSPRTLLKLFDDGIFDLQPVRLKRVSLL